MAHPHPLLVDLAAGRPTTARAPDDPDALLASAYEHRMNGLLWSRVAAGEVELPREAMRALAREDLAVQAHHRQLWRILADVRERLAAADVEVATIKGVAAEHRWYERAGERPCKDLDLLLEPSATDRVDDVIDVLQPAHVLRPDAQSLVRSGTLQGLDLTVDSVELDLHVDLLKLEIPTRQGPMVWSRSVVVQGPDEVPVRTLDPEMSLIHFLLHLNKDRFSLLLGYADVGRILSRENLDWDFIDRFLAGEGLRVHAYSALIEVVQLLDLPQPPVSVPRGLRSWVWHRLWPTSNHLGGPYGFASHQHRQLIIPWTAEKRAAEALRSLVRQRIFPPAALVRVYHPETRGPYLWRLATGRLRAARARRRQRIRLRAS